MLAHDTPPAGCAAQLPRGGDIIVPLERKLAERKRGRTLMHVNFKNGSLVILAITAVACSRMTFAFFNDPEGPNLLVVTGMAAVIYLVSSAVYLSNVCPSLT